MIFCALRGFVLSPACFSRATSHSHPWSTHTCMQKQHTQAHAQSTCVGTQDTQPRTTSFSQWLFSSLLWPTHPILIILQKQFSRPSLQDSTPSFFIFKVHIHEFETTLWANPIFCADYVLKTLNKTNTKSKWSLRTGKKKKTENTRYWKACGATGAHRSLVGV